MLPAVRSTHRRARRSQFVRDIGDNRNSHVNPRGQTLLTKWEGRVVNLVVDGLSNRETAQKLGLTEHTVSNYLFRIYEKLGISTRVELVLYALRQKQQGKSRIAAI